MKRKRSGQTFSRLSAKLPSACGAFPRVVPKSGANKGCAFDGHHYSAATFLEHMDVPVWIDAQHAIAHNKVMVIDDATVIIGSFNFTKAAEEHNAENPLIIHDPALAARYTENWNKHLEHSPPYQEGAGESESQVRAMMRIRFLDRREGQCGTVTTGFDGARRMNAERGHTGPGECERCRDYGPWLSLARFAS
jgi:PLD-like domain